jgi:hypothetical protein
MLGMVDFGPNPHGPEFEEYGVCRVRFGKARRDSPQLEIGKVTSTRRLTHSQSARCAGWAMVPGLLG